MKTLILSLVSLSSVYAQASAAGKASITGTSQMSAAASAPFNLITLTTSKYVAPTSTNSASNAYLPGFPARIGGGGDAVGYQGSTYVNANMIVFNPYLSGGTGLNPVVLAYIGGPTGTFQCSGTSAAGNCANNFSWFNLQQLDATYDVSECQSVMDNNGIVYFSPGGYVRQDFFAVNTAGAAAVTTGGGGASTAISNSANYAYFPAPASFAAAGKYGWCTNVFDAKHNTITYVPTGAGPAICPSKLVQYAIPASGTLSANFTAANFAAFDLSTIDPNACGYLGGSFDGQRYLYIWPLRSGPLIRYDTTASFTSPGSYKELIMSNLGVPAPLIIRGSGIQVSSASSDTIPWPSGTVAGDLAVIFVSNAYNISLPTGWTQLYYTYNDTYINGLVASKVLNSTDISAGNVVVNLGGAYDGSAAIVTFVGAPTIQQTVGDQQSQPATSDASLTTAATGGEYTALYFGSGRSDGNSPVVTVSLGASLQSANDATFGAAIYSQTLPSSATVNPAFSFSSSSTILDAVVVVETAASTGYPSVIGTGNLNAVRTASGYGGGQMVWDAAGANQYMYLAPFAVLPSTANSEAQQILQSTVARVKTATCGSPTAGTQSCASGFTALDITAPTSTWEIFDLSALATSQEWAAAGFCYPPLFGNACSYGSAALANQLVLGGFQLMWLSTIGGASDPKVGFIADFGMMYAMDDVGHALSDPSGWSLFPRPAAQGSGVMGAAYDPVNHLLYPGGANGSPPNAFQLGPL